MTISDPVDGHALQGAFVSTRLHRLTDVIAEQGDEMLQAAGIIAPARGVSCVLLVGDEGQVSVADIAKALDQPHQLATQRIDALVELGVLGRVGDPKDGRRKILVLTAMGQDQYARLKARLAEAATAFAQLYEEIDCDLAAMADRAAAALRARPLLERIEALAGATINGDNKEAST